MALVLFYKSRLRSSAIAPQLRGKRAAAAVQEICTDEAGAVQHSQQLLHMLHGTSSGAGEGPESAIALNSRPFFFLAIPGKPMRAPDEKQRSNMVHPYRCFRALWRGKVAALAFVSVSHPGMWYKACFCHVSAPVSALH